MNEEGFYVIEIGAREPVGVPLADGWRGSATWTRADNCAEAEAFGLTIAHRKYPVEEGWQEHAAVATLVPEADLQQKRELP